MKAKLLLIFTILLSYPIYSQELLIGFNKDNKAYINGTIPLILQFDLGDYQQELMWHPRKTDLIKAIEIINNCIANKVTKYFDIKSFTYKTSPLSEADIVTYREAISQTTQIIIDRTSNKLYEHMLDLNFYHSSNRVRLTEVLVSVENEWISIR